MKKFILLLIIAFISIISKAQDTEDISQYPDTIFPPVFYLDSVKYIKYSDGIYIKSEGDVTYFLKYINIETGEPYIEPETGEPYYKLVNENKRD